MHVETEMKCGICQLRVVAFEIAQEVDVTFATALEDALGRLFV